MENVELIEITVDRLNMHNELDGIYLRLQDGMECLVAGDIYDELCQLKRENEPFPITEINYNANPEEGDKYEKWEAKVISIKVLSWVRKT